MIATAAATANAMRLSDRSFTIGVRRGSIAYEEKVSNDRKEITRLFMADSSAGKVN